TVIGSLNEVLAARQTLMAYVQGFVTTNSRDDLAQAKRSELELQGVRLTQLVTRFTAWIGGLDVPALIAQSDVARAHEFMLRKTQVQAAHLMSPGEEGLAAELTPTGSTAWSKLHDNVTSQLEVPVE